jgi:polyferredoxin
MVMSKPTATLPYPPSLPTRAAHRWLLATIMVLVIALGWRFPVVGYAVPAAMLIGIGSGFFRGRYACGNLCPRGSFLDTFFSGLGGTRPLPQWLRRMPLRWTVVALMMGTMVVRILENPADPLHWGHVFWFMCAVTTAVGLLLGVVYQPRAWCSVCPVGTMANGIGGDKAPLRIAPDCTSCRRCETSCPMELSIAEHRAAGALPHRDCLRCSSCLSVCPRGALSWPDAA